MVRPNLSPLRPTTEAERAWSLVLSESLQRRLDALVREAGDPVADARGFVGPDLVTRRFWTAVAACEQAIREAIALVKAKPRGWRRECQRWCLAALRAYEEAQARLPDLFDPRQRPNLRAEARRGRREFAVDRTKKPRGPMARKKDREAYILAWDPGVGTITDRISLLLEHLDEMSELPHAKTKYPWLFRRLHGQFVSAIPSVDRLYKLPWKKAAPSVRRRR